LMDYPARARLKIFAKVGIVELADNPEMLSSFNLGDYKFKPERIMLFHIEAFDWNCPQHIVPRFTVDEINEALQPKIEEMAMLEKENQMLKEKIKSAGL
jgi:uncharacterized protein